MNWSALPLLLLLTTAQGWSLQVSQEIVMTSGEMVISFRVPGPIDQNATLTWPIDRADLLVPPKPDPEAGFEFAASDRLSLMIHSGLDREVVGSFTIRHDQALGRVQVFPVPRCLEEEATTSLEVLLPPGFVVSNCSLGCLRTYDHDARTVRLSWPSLGDEYPHATLVEPGKGEDEIMAQVRRILLRSYLFWAVCLVLSGFAVFAGLQLIRVHL